MFFLSIFSCAGEPLPAATLEACKAADAILFGAIGGPKWDAAKSRPEQGLLALRKGLGLFANLRPVSIISPQLAELSPLKKELLEGVDMVFVRELTGGIYFGQRQEAKDGKGLFTRRILLVISFFFLFKDVYNRFFIRA